MAPVPAIVLVLVLELELLRLVASVRVKKAIEECRTKDTRPKYERKDERAFSTHATPNLPMKDGSLKQARR